MTVSANGCGTGVSVGMAADALKVHMGARERKLGLVMVESVICISCRMTGVASLAVVGITANTLVMIIGVGFVVLMAVDAAEHPII